MIMVVNGFRVVEVEDRAKICIRKREMGEEISLGAYRRR